MKALLLAAGFGTRLKPITDTTPKCLVSVGGQPLLGRWFEMLFAAEIESALVNTHYLAGQVTAFVAQSPWRPRITLVHEPELLGTAGTVLANRESWGSDPIMLVHADNLSIFNVSAFIAAHRRRPAGTVMTMMTFETDAPQTCGIVSLDDEGRVTGFFEKVANPPGNLANAALYILEQPVVDFIAGLGTTIVDFSNDVIPHFIGRIATWHNDIYHRDIGTPQSLEKAQADMRALAAQG